MTGHRFSRPTIGVLAGWQVYEGNMLDPFLEPVIRGIRTAASKHEANLLLASGIGREIEPVRPAWPIYSPDGEFVPVGPWNTDGLLIITPLMSKARSAYIKQLMAEGHPIVFIGEEEGGPAVDIDNKLGIRQAIAHLVDHGHKQIAFIARYEDDLEITPGAPRRLTAYRSALEDFDLEFKPSLIGYGLHNRPGSRWAMHQILETHTPFTAVLASNDESAFGVMEELREAELRIPEDVAVVGFDNVPESLIQTPPLTSVHFPSFEIGYRALEMLLGFIDRGKHSNEIILIPPRLVIRQSCGCRLNTSHDYKDISRIPTTKFRGLISATDTLLAETMYINMSEARELYTRLVRAFSVSLQAEDWSGFQSEFKNILYKVADTGEDPYIWRDVLAFLRDNVYTLLGTDLQPEAHQKAKSALDIAFDTISRSTRYSDIQHSVEQRKESDQLGWMISGMMKTLDKKQILNTLREYLPGIGVKAGYIAFYQAEENDPVANAVIYNGGKDNQDLFMFRSREFPPRELFRDHEPFTLVILPLFIFDELAGFVAFDTTNQNPCAVIVRQLSSAFSSAQLYREALESKRLAEEANLLKSRFLSIVSHDLRTPLNVISGLSNTLMEEQRQSKPIVPAQYQEDLLRMNASARHLDRLIGDVLDLAQSEVGKLKLDARLLDFSDILRSVALLAEQMTRDKNLRWHIEISDDLPKVWGDRTRLQQVLLNLLSNATKFTEKGDISLKATNDSEKIIVTVSDTGLGVLPEDQKSIFEEFRRSERAVNQGYGGLGLGLAISQKLIKMHGGEIWVESSGENGKGSTFTFTLPVINNIAESPPISPLQSLTDIVLLIVRSFPEGERLQTYLETQGFHAECLVVTDTNIGWLEQLATIQPSGIILDLEVASDWAWIIIKRLKENPSTRNIPVLFCKLNYESDKGAVIKLDYLTKPINMSDLVLALNQYDLGKQGDKILIVDNEPSVLEVHIRMVQAELPQARILKARNGREALQLIQAEQPDLVLLDLIMPELDGFGVLDAMQEQESTRNIPVIVLTGLALTEDDMARLNHRVITILGKNMFSSKEMVNYINKMLARKQNQNKEMQQIVRKAIAYIHKHYVEPISQDAIAHHVGISKRHLARCFQQEVGISPTTYLNRFRIKESKELLKMGKSITQVAIDVGYFDRTYFARAFRREVGLSPSTYQKNLDK